MSRIDIGDKKQEKFEFSIPKDVYVLMKEIKENFNSVYRKVKLRSGINFLKTSKDIIEKFSGQVPSDLDSLRSLAGVGRKTANVVYSVAFGGDAIAVDTHVFRVSARIGFAEGKTPLDTEKRLMEALPKEKWSHMHHAIIFHGRRVCTARNPKCEDCVIRLHCKYNNSQKRGQNVRR